jgi:hypothetical protein
MIFDIMSHNLYSICKHRHKRATRVLKFKVYATDPLDQGLDTWVIFMWPFSIINKEVKITWILS